VYASSYTKRIAEHRVNPEFIGERLARRAQEQDDWLFDVVTGLDVGKLSNPERPPGEVECAFVIANPLGLSVVLVTTCHGSTDSQIKLANRFVMGAGDLWDDRVGPKRKKIAFAKLQEVYERYWNGMETLGAMAD
jgi:hypothetical protein